VRKKDGSTLALAVRWNARNPTIVVPRAGHHLLVSSRAQTRETQTVRSMGRWDLIHNGLKDLMTNAIDRNVRIPMTTKNVFPSLAPKEESVQRYQVEDRIKRENRGLKRVRFLVGLRGKQRTKRHCLGKTAILQKGD
jgi:hypothetical protein